MTVASSRGRLLAVIGDEDTCTGFLLGGIGELDKNRRPNFLAVDKDTPLSDIENAFTSFLTRDDIAIILVVQNVAEMIRHLIDAHTDPIPAILEIPSKDKPYDATKDSILKRAKGMFSTEDFSFSAMSGGEYKLSADAREFLPSTAPERMESEEIINAIVSQAFDLDEEVSEPACLKLQQIIQSQSIPTIPSYVGGVLVDASVSCSGNATLSFRIIKRLQSSAPPSVNSLLECGIFEKIHEHTLCLINSDLLREMAGIKPLGTSESGDSVAAGSRPVIIVELLHLIVMCITELYKTEDGQTNLPPLNPCIDLCILAEVVLQVHLDSVRSGASKSEPPSPSQATVASATDAVIALSISLQSPQRSSRKNEWNCLLDAFLSRLGQTLPYINLIFQYSETYTLPTTWVSTSCLNPPPPPKDDQSLLKTDFITSQHLATLVDRVLFQVKHMMVLDDGFPSKWIRSTAMDLLLAAASSFSSIFVCGETTNEWRGGSDDEDDVVIEGVTSTDKPEVLRDFRHFLASTVRRTSIVCLLPFRWLDFNTKNQAGKAHLRHDVEIIKSESDDRLYRSVTLTNQLKVLLISDSQTDKAAACLAVGVGSFYDPVDVPGLAHFCEHMILLGSQKYPEENGYSKFITSHNGYCNAFTSTTETCYVFDVAPEYLHEALERFSEIFVAPLFTESATEREVNAVDSEHEKNLAIDNRRIVRIDKVMAAPDHDYAKFTTGNKDTLFNNLKTKSKNIRDELFKFYKRFYSSSIMAVTILGKESLDEMEDRYASLFENIPNRNVVPKSWLTTPWTKEYLQQKIYMVPVRDFHELRIIWPIKDYTKFYKSAPCRYLMHLLGHESAGSLLSALKRRSLATNLMTETYRPGSGFACVILYASLTENGLVNVDEVITLVFQYLNMLRHEGFQRWIFEEQRDIQALRFRFKGKEDPFEYVYRLSPRMFLYPPEDLLTAPHILAEFRPDLVEEILSSLTPHNFRCIIVSQKVADRCNETEEFYGARYGCDPIPSEKIETWCTCGLCPELHLPSRNPYMPTEFGLRCESSPDPEDMPSGPRILLDSAGTRLWFKQDNEFKLPKCYVNFNLISPLWAQDQVRDLLLQLFVNLFDDSVNEEAYQCSLAGLCFNITASAPTLRLNFSGYSHKMPVLVENIANRLVQFTRPDEKRYAVLLEKMKLKVKNFTSFSPLDQADGYCASVLFDRTCLYEERCAALNEITYEELVEFIPSFFHRVFVETMVYGNVDVEEALKFNEILTNALHQHTHWRSPVAMVSPQMREVEIPTGPSYVYKRINRRNAISAILVYYQNLPITSENCAIHRLFDQLIREPAFNTLRTEKQLGYIVRAGWHMSNSFQGIHVVIQSKHHPRELDEHIEEFVASMETILSNMPTSEFNAHIESVIALLLEKPKKMSQQATRYWSQILRQRYDFDRFEREAEIIRNTSKDHVIAFYNTYIKAASESRRKLAIYVIAENAPPTQKEDTGVEIKNPIEFKRTQPLRPLTAACNLMDRKSPKSTMPMTKGTH
ncbi:Insulin-degrading enzyme [Taenia crassiceps]|uniref:Insulin-degrading enzyme n=1 Tax=Taenia crassiceps TaxID=6207 RepID=A0ABR4QPX8_9CEST